MNIVAPTVQKSKLGTCPHGLPPGACPICSGMGGGGGAKKTDRPSGEMSWAECVAVGQMLKSQRLAQLQRDVAMRANLHAPVNISTKLENIAQSIAKFAEKLTDIVQKGQAKPTLAFKALEVAIKIALPILNLSKEIPILAQKVLNFVSEKFADISDKLCAVLGELKNAIEKNFSNKFNDFKKKTKSLFGLFESKDIDDEETQIEKKKRIFELKTFTSFLKEKIFTKKETKELKNDTDN